MSQQNTPSTGANQGTSLFGNVSSTTSSFGMTPSQPSSTLFGGNSGGTSSGNIFGSSMTTTPSSTTGYTFGQRPADSQGTGPMSFMGGTSTPNRTSGAQQTSGNTISGGNANISNEQPSNSGAATPNTTKTTSLLGSTTPAGPPPATSSSSIFGNLGQSTGFFGNNNSKSENTPGSLGKLNTQQQFPSGNTSSSIFTQNNSANTSNQPQQSSLFNSASGQQAPSMFGSQTTASGSTLFGNVQKPAQTGSQQPEKQQSGQVQDGISQETSRPNTTSFFTSQPASTPAPSNSTASAATTGPEKPGLFANNSSSAGQNTGLFANLGTKKDDAASSGKQQESQVTSSTSAATTATTSTTAPANATLFGSNASTAAPGSVTAQAMPATTSTGQSNLTADSSTKQDLASSTTLSSSMVGPPPNTQSRLKNKSMDEIITRWASDLSKYQKEFQAQADKVARWDQTLLQNANEIAELYSKTFHAERDTAEVQKQLSIVESHQEELSQWLDRYEGEVDAMMTRQMGQGETFQGPDQERERTYKTAERVSEHLDEMSKELTTMIEEVNDVSGSISKISRPDDPLSQIVKILNSHLSQLQVIDQGTAALESRIKVAQRDSQRLSTGIRGGVRNDDADAFYRSYINRG